jgi:hypothetical protein
MRVADLPQERGPAQYEVTNCEQKSRVFTLSKRQRQIIDLLISAPTYCASPVRIGDAVHIMKREIGLDVETKFYPGNTITGAGAYGVYFLKSQVRRIDRRGVSS